MLNASDIRHEFGRSRAMSYNRSPLYLPFLVSEKQAQSFFNYNHSIGFSIWQLLLNECISDTPRIIKREV
jgi:hypothetical protein